MTRGTVLRRNWSADSSATTSASSRSPSRGGRSRRSFANALTTAKAALVLVALLLVVLQRPGSTPPPSPEIGGSISASAARRDESAAASGSDAADVDALRVAGEGGTAAADEAASLSGRLGGADGAPERPLPSPPSRPSERSNNNVARRRYYREITFTNYGWYQRNSTAGLKAVRSLTGRDFVDAVTAHDRFNRSAWSDLESNPDPSRPILAFLDVETCGDFLWPNFGGDWTSTSDTEGGRAAMRKGQVKEIRSFCPAVERALASPAMSAPESRLVVLSCEMGGRPREAKECAYRDRDPTRFGKLVVGHLTAHRDFVHPRDFGVPPLPVKPVALSEERRNDLESCRPKSRKYTLSFIGRPRFPEFQEYMTPLHGKDGAFVRFTTSHYDESDHSNKWGTKMLVPLPPENQTQDLYYSLLADSYYAPSPRGDDLYSIRFSEALSAGTVPVVYADGWVLPYNADVVNWTDVAILLPQGRVNETMDVITSISEARRCQMQREALRFYETYVADSHGRLRAILKIMDARLGRGAGAETVNFTSAPGNFRAPVPLSRLERLRRKNKQKQVVVMAKQKGGGVQKPS